jgi:hypothetical protein
MRRISRRRRITRRRRIRVIKRMLTWILTLIIKRRSNTNRRIGSI